MKAISLLLFISFIHYSFPWAFFPLFKKYGSDISYSGFATFDAREFDEGEEMYFKVEAYKDQIIDRDVPYNYRNDIDGTSTGSLFYAKVTSTSSYTENHHHYTRQYFKIKKQKSQFEPAGTGNYLVITLPVEDGHYCRIENTKEDEGGIPTWAIVVIIVVIVVIVLIIVGVIIYCCYRRKKRMQQMSQTNAATVAVASAYATQQNLQAQAYQAQAYQAQAYQAQAYQAQVNQAQAQAYQAQVQANQQAQAQAHYQEQMNAAPNYSQQNYQTPVNSNDVGYSSKAVM